MKKSSSVQVSIVLAFATGAVTSGCSSGRQCVDTSGRRLDDTMCSRPGSYAGAHWISTGGFGGSSGSSYGG